MQACLDKKLLSPHILVFYGHVSQFPVKEYFHCFVLSEAKHHLGKYEFCQLGRHLKVLILGHVFHQISIIQKMKINVYQYNSPSIFS